MTINRFAIPTKDNLWKINTLGVMAIESLMTNDSIALNTTMSKHDGKLVRYREIGAGSELGPPWPKENTHTLIIYL